MNEPEMCRYCQAVHPVEGSTCADARIDRATVMAEEAREAIRNTDRRWIDDRTLASAEGVKTTKPERSIPPGEDQGRPQSAEPFRSGGVPAPSAHSQTRGNDLPGGDEMVMTYEDEQ